MRDRRLLGVWRSDKRRTVRELQARRDIPEKSQQALAGMLGKLELRFTETRCYSTFNGRTSSVPYVVVAKDSTSVAIVSRDPLLEAEEISHVHFDGSRFWINVGTGIFREFFTRVKPPTSTRKSAK